MQIIMMISVINTEFKGKDVDNYTWTQLKTGIIGPFIPYKKKCDPRKTAKL